MTAKHDELPRYRVTEKSYIGHNLVEAGEEVEYDGVPGSKLVPLNDAAAEAKELAPAQIAAAQAKAERNGAPALRVVTDPSGGKDAEKRLADLEKKHQKALDEQRQAHEKELAELRAKTEATPAKAPAEVPAEAPATDSAELV